jgi:hypothetical protein
VDTPATVALPVIFTVSVVLDPNANPFGSVPDDKVHFSGGTPPVAVTVALYAAFKVASGREVVVIIGGGSIITVNLADCFGKSTDVAVIVTVVSAVTAPGATKLAVVELSCVSVPDVTATGDNVNVTPPLSFVSFNTDAVISGIVPPCPRNIVPFGEMVTWLNVDGVPEQAENWIRATIMNASKHEILARLFMAPPSVGTHVIAVGCTHNI